MIAVVVIALTLLNTGLILVGKHENSERASETHALAVVNHRLALANCHNTGTLANVERAFIDRQEKQTQVLLKSGITFGIPPEQLPKLIAASKKSRATFLNDLDALTATSCTDGIHPAVIVVKPHRKRKPHREAKGHASSAPSAAAVVGAVKAGQAPRRATPRTLPVPRPTRTVTTTVTPSQPSRAQEAPPTEHTSTTPTTPVTPTTPARPEPERRPVIPPVPCVRVAGVTLC